MAKQKQPRPDFTQEKFRTYTYHGIVSANGVTTYPRYSRSIRVYYKRVSFPRYVLSRGDQLGLNPLPFSHVTEERLTPFVRKPKNTIWDTSRLYTVGITNKSDPNAGKVKQGAINKFMTELNDNRVDLLMLFAERKKTIDMVANRIWQAYYFLRALKKGNLDKAIRIAKNGKADSKKGAGINLELQYGWLQLTGDLHKLCTKPMVPIPSRRLKVPYGRPWGDNEKIICPPGTDNAAGTSVWFGKTAYTVIADIELDMPFIASASTLGLTNPAFVAWDALPWSLVVDWFLPIGPWLETMSALDGFIVKDKLLCEKTRFESYNETDSGNAHFKQRTWNRTKSFDLKYRPLLKNPLSIMHALNGISMIRQKFSGETSKPFKRIF